MAPDNRPDSGALQAPTLSLILCSRNDSYLGNSRYRLETALNYTAAQVEALDELDHVEILVADWGSETPLQDALTLSAAAARIVWFIWIPPVLARELQGDSPFPEVLALNAAARRARGDYIGRIDQDTLAGRRFLREFLAWARGETRDAPPTASLLFSNRRSIPYRLAVRCPPLWAVTRFITWYRRWLRVEWPRRGEPFYWSDVGIWMVHRELWDACGGYDERMIYMNDMEIDMTGRLLTKYPMVDLGARVGYDFFHLDHYHPRGSRSSSTHRAVNCTTPRAPLGFRPSGDRWGLVGHPLGMARQSADRIAPAVSARFWLVEAPSTIGMGLFTVALALCDTVHYRWYAVLKQTWTRRWRLAAQAVSGQGILRWPLVLARLWRNRPSARARRVQEQS